MSMAVKQASASFASEPSPAAKRHWRLGHTEGLVTAGRAGASCVTDVPSRDPLL